LKALYLVLLLFVGLAISSKDGRDRWIYGAFAVATLLALIHYRQIPGLTHLRLPFWVPAANSRESTRENLNGLTIPCARNATPQSLRRVGTTGLSRPRDTR